MKHIDEKCGDALLEFHGDAALAFPRLLVKLSEHKLESRDHFRKERETRYRTVMNFIKTDRYVNGDTKKAVQSKYSVKNIKTAITRAMIRRNLFNVLKLPFEGQTHEINRLSTAPYLIYNRFRFSTYAQGGRLPSDNTNTLVAAAVVGAFEVVEHLTTIKSVKDDFTFFGCALEAACARGDTSMVSFLLKHNNYLELHSRPIIWANRSIIQATIHNKAECLDLILQSPLGPHPEYSSHEKWFMDRARGLKQKEVFETFIRRFPDKYKHLRPFYPDVKT
jgi:hypothetical protein